MRGAPIKGEDFDPRKLSPSRMNALATCGIAFKMKYLDGLPEERSGSAALRGSVYHKALEDWAPNRSADLLTLVRSAWLSETEGTSVNDFIGIYAGLAPEVVRAEHECKIAFKERTKKDSKAIHLSGEWKRHPVKAKVDALFAEWLPRLREESFWQFNEFDPLPKIYNESLVWARRYQERFGHLPPALYTEFGFDVEWKGFRLNGYIDAIEPLLDRDSGELCGLGIEDYKTYGAPPPQHKDYRQMVVYDIAIRDLLERGQLTLPPVFEGLPIYVGIDYVRWEDSWRDPDDGDKPFPPRRYWRIGPGDYERFEREAGAYSDTVERRAFLPAQKGQKVDFCSFPGSCCMRSTAAAGGSAELVEVNL